MYYGVEKNNRVMNSNCFVSLITLERGIKRSDNIQYNILGECSSRIVSKLYELTRVIIQIHQKVAHELYGL